MNKLEELKAAADAALDADALAAYQAELKKTKEQTKVVE
jgi:hypothetical protein